MKKILIIGLVLLPIFGCRSYSLTESSNDYQQHQKTAIKKVLVLPLDFMSVDMPNDYKKAPEEMETKGMAIVKNTLQVAFQKKSVEPVFLDDVQKNNVQEFFEYIVPLKKELLTASELHEDIFKQKHRKVYTNKTFARVPKIRPRYMELAQKYGVRYTLFVGVFTNKKEHYQYVILADLIKSEIVFRNLKFVKGRARRGNIEPIMYDTFLSLYP